MFGLFKRKPQEPRQHTGHIFYSLSDEEFGATIVCGFPFVSDDTGGSLWYLLPVPLAMFDGYLAYPLVSVMPGVATGKFLYGMPVTIPKFHEMRQNKGAVRYAYGDDGGPETLQKIMAAIRAAEDPDFLKKMEADYRASNKEA